MLNHRNDMHQARLTPVFIGHELHEADQVILEERTDEDAPIQESHFHSAQGLEVLAVVPKRFTLPNWGLVVDGRYPPNEAIVEWHLPNDHPVLFGLSNFIPYLEINLMLHPVVKARNTKGGDIVPFQRVSVFRGGVRQFLNESEEINPRSKFSERSHSCVRVFQKLVALSIEKTDSDQPSADADVLATDFHSLTLSTLKHGQRCSLMAKSETTCYGMVSLVGQLRVVVPCRQFDPMGAMAYPRHAPGTVAETVPAHLMSSMYHSSTIVTHP